MTGYNAMLVTVDDGDERINYVVGKNTTIGDFVDIMNEDFTHSITPDQIKHVEFFSGKTPTGVKRTVNSVIKQI